VALPEPAYWPAAQFAQLDELASALNFPAPQFEQPDSPVLA